MLTAMFIAFEFPYFICYSVSDSVDVNYEFPGVFPLHYCLLS